MKCTNLRLFFSSTLMLALSTFASAGGKNILSGDTSFETGYGPFEKKGTLSNKESYDAKSSLMLDSSTNTKTPHVFKLQADKAYVFSVYMKADTANAKVTLMAYRSNWKGNNISKTFTLDNNWKRYTLDIPPLKAGDWNNFWLYITPGKDKDFNIYIDACQFEEERLTEYTASEKINPDFNVVSPVEGNVFYPDENVKLAVKIFNASSVNENVSTSVKIEDYYGNTVLEKNFQILLKSKESNVQSIELPALNKKGFYFAELKSVSPSTGERTLSASFCIINKPFQKKLGRAAMLGASGAHESRIAACERIGVNWMCTDMRWTNEISPGKYDEPALAKFDKIFDTVKAHNMNIAVYTRRTPTWASEYPDPSVIDTFPPKEEYIEEYGRFIYDMVSRFKGKVKVWQCWGGEIDGLRNHVNEILHKDENWFIDRYSKMVETGYKAAKKADPDCIWSACSVSGVDCDHASNFSLSRKIFAKAGKYIDEFVVHPYCWPMEFGEGQRVQSPEEHKLMEIYKTATEFSGKPLWNGEYGFAIYLNEKLNSKSAKMMADYTVRSLIITAAAENVNRIQYYSFWSGGSEGRVTYDQWFWPNPLPSVAAYSAVAFMLNGADKGQEIKLNKKVKAFCFHKNGGSLTAIWVPENSIVNMKIQDSASLNFYDIMGNEIKKASEIELNGSPLYIESALTPDKIMAILNNAKFDIEPVDIGIKLKNSKVLSVYVRNLLSENLDGTLEADIPVKGGRIRTVKMDLKAMRPDVFEEISIPVPEGIDLSQLNKSTIPCTVKTAQGQKKIEGKINSEKCLIFVKSPKIDANLSEWNNRPYIELKDSSFLYPIDAIAHNTWTGSGDLSAKVWVGWDDKNFYFAADVTDDLHLNTKQAKEIYSGDSIEMAFDPSNDAIVSEIAGYDKDDFDFAFGYNSNEKKTYFYQYYQIPPRKPEGVECAIKREGNSTKYEIKIPFELLQIKACEGTAFGYNFTIFDCDSLKEGNSTSEYWMSLTPGIAQGKKPALFKTFILEK